MLKHTPRTRLRLKREIVKVIPKLSSSELRNAKGGDGCTDSSSTMQMNELVTG